VAGLLTTWLRSVSGGEGALREGVARRDGARVRAAAHLIKSPSLSVGALALGLLCAQIEEAASRGDWPQLEALLPAFDSIYAQATSAVGEQIRRDTAALGPT
jgi:HPt (histidine-containing phosphotransfer) domain-containing protein